MKKFVYILFGLFTFSVSSWLFNLHPLVTPVSLCEISQHSQIYQSKQIYIEAYLEVVGSLGDDFTYYSVFDFGNNCFTGASLEISETVKEQLSNDENLKTFVNELRQKNTRSRDKHSDGNFIGKVKIIGSIEKVSSHNETAGMIAPPPFAITANEIKQISPIQFMSYEEIFNLSKSYRHDDF